MENVGDIMERENVTFKMGILARERMLELARQEMEYKSSSPIRTKVSNGLFANPRWYDIIWQLSMFRMPLKP